MKLRRSSVSLSARIASALKPSRAIGGLRYRLEGISETPYRPRPELKLETPPEDNFKHISFTFALIALSAKVACAGGNLSREKYLAFREAFPLTGGMCGKLRELFTLACESPAPFEHYVAQVKQTFPRRMPLYISLVERLFRIAGAEHISREEERMLAKIAHMLGIGAAEYTAIRERAVAPKPHHILGVEKRTPAAALKKQYHALMRRYHPDRYASENLSPEVALLLRLKVSEINQAYRTLSRKAA